MVDLQTKYFVYFSTLGDNTFIYALNPVAEEALHIAQNDTKVKQIINEQKGKAVTIAAIQPTTVMESKDGKVSYSSTGFNGILWNNRYFRSIQYTCDSN
jgi:hypothetical protein